MEVDWASLTQNPPSEATVSYTNRALVRRVSSHSASCAGGARPRVAAVVTRLLSATTRQSQPIL
eukprot:scaffold4272_cov129-Isochrysis_galbana.AAC.2